VIAGLRSLAAFLEANPDVPAPRHVDVTGFASGSDEAKRAEIDKVAALISSEIDADYLRGGHYRTSRNFGPVHFAAVAIPSAASARHQALMSYEGAVTPEEL
jgi:hypothetical protein